jgi:hypothetical protein
MSKCFGIWSRTTGAAGRDGRICSYSVTTSFSSPRPALSSPSPAIRRWRLRPLPRSGCLRARGRRLASSAPRTPGAPREVWRRATGTPGCVPSSAGQDFEFHFTNFNQLERKLQSPAVVAKPTLLALSQLVRRRLDRRAPCCTPRPNGTGVLFHSAGPGAGPLGVTRNHWNLRITWANWLHLSSRASWRIASERDRASQAFIHSSMRSMSSWGRRTAITGCRPVAGQPLFLRTTADSDEAGQAFQYEAGHPFRDEAGHGSDLKPATWRGSPRVAGMMFSILVLVKRVAATFTSLIGHGGHFRCAFAGVDAGGLSLFGTSFAGDGASCSAWVALSLRMLSPVSSIL